jgi:hypothetical protein
VFSVNFGGAARILTSTGEAGEVAPELSQHYRR